MRFPFSYWKPGASGPTFDPATLPLSSWLKPSYPGLPWPGSASANALSALNPETSLGATDPIAGPALNGYVSANYVDATYQSRMTAVAAGVWGGAGDSWSFSKVFRVASANAIAANPYENVQLLCGDAQWGFGVSLSGVTTFVFDGAGFPSTTLTSPGAWLGNWHRLDVRYRKVAAVGHLEMRIDTTGATWTETTPYPAFAFLSELVRRGKNSYNAGKTTNFSFVEAWTAASWFDTPTFDQWALHYVSPKYGI